MDYMETNKMVFPINRVVAQNFQTKTSIGR